jgi:hypothetical protein
MLIDKCVPGSTWGEWTVLELPSRTNGFLTINVRCSCGNIRNIRVHGMINGTSKRCLPCGRKVVGNKNRKPGTEWNTWRYRYKTNARNRNLDFDLAMEQFKEICLQDCFYCGRSPESRPISKWTHITANGVDRIDSTLGYNELNCVPCCSVCNRMKLNMNQDLFLEHIGQIYKHLLKNK